MDFLRDPIWTFLSIIITATLTIISLAVSKRWQSRKRIAYEIISNTPVLAVSPRIKHRVKILFDGKPVTDVDLLTIKLWNAGNVPINRNDYEKPFTFSFGTNAKILSTNTFDAKPGNINVVLTQAKNSITLQPTLLNPGDSVKLAVLITQFKEGDIEVDTRIEGVKQVTESKPAISAKAFLPLIVTLLACVNIIGYSLPTLSRNTITLQIGEFFIAAGIAIGTSALWLRRLRTLTGVIASLIIASLTVDIIVQITVYLFTGRLLITK